MPRKSSPSAPTQRLNFFSLPPEIRNEIYSYLAQTTTTVIHIRPPSHRKSKSRWPATPLSLACTCRALYAEFAPLFYATTAYRSYASQAYSVALWLETVKAWTGHAIQTIRVPKTLYCCRPHGDRIVKVGERGVLENEPREWKTVTWYRRKLRNAQAAAAAAAGVLLVA
ncbi:hypothetical protein F4778DRAFT_785957 [Xylariomycetidae sp. FL2044]|nr:hypothetical protein F4778DRAFT_788630 [Xylariomycetidae sp. FL2044]KAH9883448.1 hypothetical protein F4778DRAFT_788592 [Xylariomycetidae sp. FL2044]KAH9884144.1 hypothetical protein F4778DRAFT_787916 [Xylariomycetidae sp. FL2044]KAH9888760.1 hypothetical protein F4778DRAFT_785957 [Xylariomycetidae sp. FL2044]